MFESCGTRGVFLAKAQLHRKKFGLIMVLVKYRAKDNFFCMNSIILFFVCFVWIIVGLIWRWVSEFETKAIMTLFSNDRIRPRKETLGIMMGSPNSAFSGKQNIIYIAKCDDAVVGTVKRPRSKDFRSISINLFGDYRVDCRIIGLRLLGKLMLDYFLKNFSFFRMLWDSGTFFFSHKQLQTVFIAFANIFRQWCL